MNPNADLMSSAEIEADPGSKPQVILISVLGCHAEKGSGKSEILEPGQKVIELHCPKVEGFAQLDIDSAPDRHGEIRLRCGVSSIGARRRNSHNRSGAGMRWDQRRARGDAG